MNVARIIWRPPDELSEFLDGLADRVSDFTSVMRVAADLMVRDIRQNITSRGQGSWTPPAESTIERAGRAGYPWNHKGAHAQLRLTDALFNSFLRQWSPMEADAVTAHPGAQFQEDGTKRYQMNGKRYGIYKAGEARPRQRGLSAAEKKKGHSPTTFRRSKTEITQAGLRGGITSTMHTPERAFMYFSDSTRDIIFQAVQQYALNAQAVAA